MNMYCDDAAVQLAAVLCLIPLTLDNCMMQVSAVDRPLCLQVAGPLVAGPLVYQIQGEMSFWLCALIRHAA